jgi:osmotically-inducible protein OsmY
MDGRGSFVLVLVTLGVTCSGCIPAAIGLGAEAGYVATQSDRTTEEVLTDQVLVTKVKAKLIADSIVPGFDINVDSHKSIITLRGALRSRAQIDRAVEIADNTDGVVEVVSKLVLEH